MVIIMQLKNLCGDVGDFISKTRMDSAPKLHQLFNQDSAPFKIPTARELILEQLQFNKWCSIEYADLYSGIDEDAEMQELCKLINVDWQDIDATVIDARLNDKHKHVC